MYYLKPKTASLMGIGKYGSITKSLSIFFTEFWIGLVNLKRVREKYSHFENMALIFQFETQSIEYFTEKNHFNKVKNGIILKNERFANVFANRHLKEQKHFYEALKV